MKKPIVAVVLSIIVIFSIWWWKTSVTPPQVGAEAPVKIVVGLESGLTSSSVWHAAYKGFFKDQGLNVEVIGFDSGRTALKTMLEQGTLDIAGPAQTPVMFYSFSRSDYAIIAGITAAKNDLKIVARRDMGIAQAGDLKGKRIGVTKGSTGHYFLGAFLRVKGLRLDDVNVVEFKADELAQAMVDGKVDAISTWEPHAMKAVSLLGVNALPFDSQALFRQDLYLVAMHRFIEKYPQALQRFLRAVEVAEADMVANPTEAIEIAAARSKLPPELVSNLWPTYRFKLFLDQSTLASLDDQARWALDAGLARGQSLPNYLSFIRTGPLRAMNPSVVTLIE